MKGGSVANGGCCKGRVCCKKWCVINLVSQGGVPGLGCPGFYFFGVLGVWGF